MRYSRYLAVPAILVVSIPAIGQQLQTNTAPPPPAPRDPMAINIVNQVLAVGGGADAIAIISDYSATGTVTFYQHTDSTIQGTVTVRGFGLNDFRMDASLPKGQRSRAILQGKTTVKDEAGKVSNFPPKTNVPNSDTFPYKTPMFAGDLAIPNSQLAAALKNSQLGFFYKGPTNVEGHSAVLLQIQQALPTAKPSKGPFLERNTLDVYIDSTTFQVLRTEQIIPKNVTLTTEYSNYQTVGGLAVPFSIGEKIGGQQTWVVELGQISFNSGLQDSDFEIQ